VRPSGWSTAGFREAIVASLIAGLVLLGGAWLVSHKWIPPAAAGLLWIAVAGFGLREIRRHALFFVEPMTRQAAESRIRSANSEIWSFQISGGEFTVHSVDTYRRWLDAHEYRRLKVAFANPANQALLENIVKLSGVHRVSNDKDAVEHLRQIILTSQRKYSALRAEYGERVDLRIYDCSPPFSIHAIDPMSSDRRRSIFVEFYLPGLSPRERPCVLMKGKHSAYKLFVEQSRDWFDQANSVVTSSATLDEPAGVESDLL
jgi:hypothetical protein